MSAEASWRPSGLSYAITTTTVAVSVPATTPVGFTSGGATARIVNIGPSDVQVVFGVGVQTAVLPTTGAPPVGQAGVFVRGGAPATYIDIPANADSFAVVANGTGVSTVVVQRGEGTGP